MLNKLPAAGHCDWLQHHDGCVFAFFGLAIQGMRLNVSTCSRACSICLGSKNIALTGGTVCKTRLQHISKLFAHAQPTSKTAQHTQLQQKGESTTGEQRIGHSLNISVHAVSGCGAKLCTAQCSFVDCRSSVFEVPEWPQHQQVGNGRVHKSCQINLHRCQSMQSSKCGTCTSSERRQALAPCDSRAFTTLM